MAMVHPHGAGRDVHTKTVVAAISGPGATRRGDQETRTVGTMTAARLAWSAWLAAHGVTPGAMERPGASWQPVVTLGERDVHGRLVQAAHLKAVPGRQPEVHAAPWRADLWQHGLVQASGVPPLGPRARRALTRPRRHVVRARARGVHRGQQGLASANLTRARVATEVLGGSGRARWAALMRGQASPAEMAERATGRRRETRESWTQALAGRVHAPPRGVLTARWGQIDPRDETIARGEAQIAAAGAPWEAAGGVRESLPGVARQTADIMVAELGPARRRVPTAEHLAAWAGVAPGHHERAGQRRSGQTRQGHTPLGVALHQAAHAAARTRHTDGSAQDHRRAGRRGQTNAIVAGAHARVVIASHRMPRQEPYRA